jgi:S1-C subfamily serine protease
MVTSVLSLLSGCTGVESSIKSSSSNSKSYVYPLTPEQARSVTYSGIMEADSIPYPMPPPLIGYVTSKQILSDHHTWQAIAEAVEYPTGENEKSYAYIFEVKHSGTLIEGPFVASKIFETMNSTAEDMCQPVELTHEQIAHCRKIPAFETVNRKPRTTPSDPQFSGTGFFITGDGYLISNYHVVKDAAKVRLLTGAGLIDTKVVQVDAANDLALLKAVGQFTPLPIASSRTVKLGGTVATVGFPDIGLQGFAPKLAKGEIASLAGAADDPRYFQVSLPVQPGNSGGALVDARGNVVGIVAAKLDASVALAVTGSLPENVNYAVKSSLLLSFLESVPDVAVKLKEPNTKDEPFEDMVKSAQDAAVLVLVY